MSAVIQLLRTFGHVGTTIKHHKHCSDSVRRNRGDFSPFSSVCHRYTMFTFRKKLALKLWAKVHSYHTPYSVLLKSFPEFILPTVPYFTLKTFLSWFLFSWFLSSYNVCPQIFLLLFYNSVCFRDPSNIEVKRKAILYYNLSMEHFYHLIEYDCWNSNWVLVAFLLHYRSKYLLQSYKSIPRKPSLQTLEFQSCTLLILHFYTLADFLTFFYIWYRWENYLLQLFKFFRILCTFASPRSAH